MSLLAIDPGNTESAYVLIDDDARPIRFGKIDNWDALKIIGDPDVPWEAAAIEMIASYGMAVGAEVFETCVWIGRFAQRMHDESCGLHMPLMVKRNPIKLHHCHSARATDSNIRQALVDRFAHGHPNHGKGTKAQPGWFHGFHSDIWQAYALAVYAHDTAQDRP